MPNWNEWDGVSSVMTLIYANVIVSKIPSIHTALQTPTYDQIWSYETQNPAQLVTYIYSFAPVTSKTSEAEVFVR